jgi:hypothetical protein
LLGAQVQQDRQQVLGVLVQEPVTPSAGFVLEVVWVVGQRIRLDPVVHALTRHAEHAG